MEGLTTLEVNVQMRSEGGASLIQTLSSMDAAQELPWMDSQRVWINDAPPETKAFAQCQNGDTLNLSNNRDNHEVCR